MYPEPPESWYEHPDYYADEPDGWVRVEDVPCEQICSEALEIILDALYRSGDIQKLESALEDLTNQFGMEIPNHEPVLTNKPDVRTNRTLGAWLQYNHAFNENLRTRRTI